MTRIISIALAKGGVGKTTTAVNLAAGLVARGKRVLLIDTDTQSQVSAALRIAPKYGLFDLVEGNIPPSDVLFEARPDLFVAAGGESLTGLKRLIVIESFNGHLLLQRKLAPLAEYFDYILIDNSPGWDELAVNVMFYANEVLCPIELEALAINGMGEFFNHVERVKEAHDTLQVRYIVPTKLDVRVAQSGEFLKGVQEKFGDIVCDPIRINVRLSEAQAHGQHIFEYAPTSRGAADYTRLIERIVADE